MSHNAWPELPVATLAFPAAYLPTLIALCRLYVPDATVWAYGSRVTGTPGPMSDLDLVVRHRDDPQQRVAGAALLAQALSDSTIPIPIDVRQWAGFPALFHDEILRGYVVLV
jgi:predicted nucleotidyltransferase